MKDERITVRLTKKLKEQFVAKCPENETSNILRELIRKFINRK